MRVEMLGAFGAGFAAGILTLGVLIWHSGGWRVQASGAQDAPIATSEKSEVQKVAPSAPATVEAIVPPKLAMPIAGVNPKKLTDTFNEGRSGHTHEALDIAAARGTPVLAVAGGR